MRPRVFHRTTGAVLLLVVMLLAAVLLGAVVAGAVFLRELNQQRTLETRKRLEVSFQELFPYPQTKPANLWRDFGYTPDATKAQSLTGFTTKGWYLQNLTTLARVGDSDPTHNPPPAFSGVQGGWNGPYWQGSVDGQGRPLDAWGRSIQLRYVTSPSSGWQVFSRGANGSDDTPANSGTAGGDDLAYPFPPYVVPVQPVSGGTYTVVLVVSVQRTSPGDDDVSVYIADAVSTNQQIPSVSFFWPTPFAGVQMNKGAKSGPYTWGYIVQVPQSTGKISIRLHDAGSAAPPGGTDLLANQQYSVPNQGFFTLNLTF